MPEKLRVYGTFRDGTAIDGKIFPALACTVLVYNLRYVFLSDTALTCHQDRYVGRRDRNGNLQCPVQGRIVADYVIFIL